ncbi:MAG: hypothetical protein DDT39_01708 [Firmicutes bacterium]|nr:hypothetical protein [candidate division NPL-UPA2 bacterium]
MQACLYAPNLIDRNDACAELLQIEPIGGYFLAVAALLIACRYLSRFI